jgi:hypothetical protein
MPAALRAPAPAPASPAAAIPQTAHDAITAPAQLPFEPVSPPPVPAHLPPPPEETRHKSSTQMPADDLDAGWDMGDDDPTALADTALAAAQADAEMQRPEIPTPPSSSEMAGDGAPGGDGIDEPGWD